MEQAGGINLDSKRFLWFQEFGIEDFTFPLFIFQPTKFVYMFVGGFFNPFKLVSLSINN